MIISVNFIVVGGNASFAVARSSNATGAQLRPNRGRSTEARGLQRRKQMDLSLAESTLLVHGCRYFKSILELLARQ